MDTLVLYHDLPCQTCSGKGYIPDEPDSRYCWECSGKGRVRALTPDGGAIKALIETILDERDQYRAINEMQQAKAMSRNNYCTRERLNRLERHVESLSWRQQDK